MSRQWKGRVTFMSSMTYANQAFAFQQVIEKYVNVRNNVYHAFVDLQIVFDEVNRLEWFCAN